MMLESIGGPSEPMLVTVLMNRAHLYCLARNCAAAEPPIQRALAVGKQVLSNTPLAEGRVSVASVAVDYARRIFDRFDDKTVLSVGAGKMAALALRHFAALSPKKLIVANRDQARAQRLAGQCNAEAASLDALDALPLTQITQSPAFRVRASETLDKDTLTICERA